jgi:hypothetical protein
MEPIAAIKHPLALDFRSLRRPQQQSRYGEALGAARRMIRCFPENRELLLIEASCSRHMRRMAGSLAALERLEALHPPFSPRAQVARAMGLHSKPKETLTA